MDKEPKRTQDLLFDALLALLTRRSFDDICVTDICGRANVHRSTFYKYYVDKYELLEVQFQGLIEQLFPGEDDLPRFLRHVAETPRLYKPLLLDPKNSEAEHIFRQRLALRLTELGFGEIAAQCRAGALLAAAAWWLRIENRDVPSERLTEQLRPFFPLP